MTTVNENLPSRRTNVHNKLTITDYSRLRSADDIECNKLTLYPDQSRFSHQTEIWKRERFLKTLPHSPELTETHDFIGWIVRLRHMYRPSGSGQFKTQTPYCRLQTAFPSDS